MAHLCSKSDECGIHIVGGELDEDPISRTKIAGADDLPIQPANGFDYPGGLVADDRWKGRDRKRTSTIINVDEVETYDGVADQCFIGDIVAHPVLGGLHHRYARI